MLRGFLRLLLVLTILGAGLIGFAYWTAVADPVVRRGAP